MILRSLPCLLTLALPAQGAVSYTRDVRPILSQHCFKCHGPDQRKGGLRLDQSEAASTKLKSGAHAIIPGDAKAGELLARITSTDEDKAMPQNSPRLSEPQIKVLRDWITEGARYELHWAYVKPVKPATTPARLLPPTSTEAQAARATLIRRVTLDLTGLPPDPSTQSTLSYESYVDTLLASPRFGEKWARHWLDLARYGDTAGYQHDVEMPLWLFRDWVIRALNADMPVDQFITEQIAGDLMPNATTQQLIATGFNRCGTATLGADNDAEELRTQLVWDRVNTLGTTFLGTSLECAQCHNHKFDPFTQRDYYSLFACFNNTAPELTFIPGDHYYITGGVLELPINIQQRTALENVRRAIAHEFAQIEAALGKTESSLPTIRRLITSPPELRTPERIAYLFLDELNKGQKIPANLEAHVERVKALARELDDARAPRSLVLEETNPRDTHILLRGNVKTPGDEVRPDAPAVLPKWPQDAPRNRLGLAIWITGRDNPLTARVMVNRWWAELFGAGIVPTPEDFGLQGEPPTDQAALDWIACELVEHGWSMKHIIKTLVMSRAYRAPVGQFPRQRLDAETLRDHALSIAGLLKHHEGGKPVPVAEDHPNLDTRSIYLRHQRGEPYSTFATFDAPDRFACTAKRPRSNTPLQALTLLNEPTFTAAAHALAARCSRHEGTARRHCTTTHRANVPALPFPQTQARRSKRTHEATQNQDRARQFRNRSLVCGRQRVVESRRDDHEGVIVKHRAERDRDRGW